MCATEVVELTVIACLLAGSACSPQASLSVLPLREYRSVLGGGFETQWAYQGAFLRASVDVRLWGAPPRRPCGDDGGGFCVGPLHVESVAQAVEIKHTVAVRFLFAGAPPPFGGGIGPMAGFYRRSVSMPGGLFPVSRCVGDGDYILSCIVEEGAWRGLGAFDGYFVGVAGGSDESIIRVEARYLFHLDHTSLDGDRWRVSARYAANIGGGIGGVHLRAVLSGGDLGAVEALSVDVCYRIADGSISLCLQAGRLRLPRVDRYATTFMGSIRLPAQ